MSWANAFCCSCVGAGAADGVDPDVAEVVVVVAAGVDVEVAAAVVVAVLVEEEEEAAEVAAADEGAAGLNRRPGPVCGIPIVL